MKRVGEILNRARDLKGLDTLEEHSEVDIILVFCENHLKDDTRWHLQESYPLNGLPFPMG